MGDPKRTEYDNGEQGSADPRLRPEYRGDNFDGLRPKGEQDDDDCYDH